MRCKLTDCIMALPLVDAGFCMEKIKAMSVPSSVPEIAGLGRVHGALSQLLSRSCKQGTRRRKAKR